MTLSKILIIAIVGLSLSACTTTESTPTTMSVAQQRYDSMDTTLINIGIETKTCVKAVWAAHPELDNILSVHKSGDAQKTGDDKAYIKKAYKGDMSALMSEDAKCRKRTHDRIKDHPDYYVRSFAPIAKESIDLTADVYRKYLEGKITGSEAASSLENVSDYLGSKWDAHNQQIVDSLNQQHFQQQQARAATQAMILQTMGAGFQDYNRQQQQFNQQRQANTPVQTRCYWSAGVMNCTSY